MFSESAKCSLFLITFGFMDKNVNPWMNAGGEAALAPVKRGIQLAGGIMGCGGLPENAAMERMITLA